jgi:PAS domain S-box-containing protein
MTNEASRHPAEPPPVAPTATSIADPIAERLQFWGENSRDFLAEATSDGRLVYTSPNVRAILGYVPGELVGISIFIHLHPEDLAAVRQQFAAPQGWVLCRYRHKDGSWRWMEASGRHSVAGNGEKRIWLIARDVTGRKWAEDEREQLQARLRRVQQFEALGFNTLGMVHDFNNILTAILINTELVRQDTIGLPEVQHHLAQVIGAGERAKALVRQILLFNQQSPHDRQPIKLQSVIGEVLKLLRPTLPRTIELHADVRDSSSFVLADTNQVHQVLMNLCINASHAMHGRHGCINIQVDSFFVETSYPRSHPPLPAGAYVRMSVIDTGAGMTAETLQRISEPFFTTKPAGEGTGLGLSLVRRIMQQHEGAIHISSQAGEGTAVEVFFPRYDADLPRKGIVPGAG